MNMNTYNTIAELVSKIEAEINGDSYNLTRDNQDELFYCMQTFRGKLARIYRSQNVNV